MLTEFLKPFSSTPLLVGISGYADFIGDAMENFHLSRRRAEKVHSEINLIRSGLNAPWVLESPLFFGESLSKDDGSPQGDSLNRLVLVTAIKPTVAAPVKAPDPLVTLPAEPIVLPPTFEELKAKGRIDVPGVNFTPGRDLLVPGATIGLDTLAAQLLRNPAVNIEIRGHVCCTPGTRDGTDLATNRDNLSEMRAAAVFKYLKDKGIASSRMKTRGMARKEPKFPFERDSAEQQGNRRVEIVILN